MHAAGEQDQALFESLQAHLVGEFGARLLRGDVVELDGVHEARTADVDDLRNLVLQRSQALLEAGAEVFRAVAEVFILDHVENGMGRRNADRAAGIRAAQAAGAGGVHDFGAAGDGCNREAAAQALGHGHQVGRDAIVFHGEQFAGTGKAGLHFVGDQQNAVLVADFAQGLHQTDRDRQEAAFALDRLDDDGGDAVRVDIGGEELLQHVDGLLDGRALGFDREGHMEDVARHGAETDLVGNDLAG